VRHLARTVAARFPPPDRRHRLSDRGPRDARRRARQDARADAADRAVVCDGVLVPWRFVVAPVGDPAVDATDLVGGVHHLGHAGDERPRPPQPGARRPPRDSRGALVIWVGAGGQWAAVVPRATQRALTTGSGEEGRW